MTRFIKARAEDRFPGITPFRIAQSLPDNNMPAEMAWPFFAIQDVITSEIRIDRCGALEDLLVQPKAEEMVLRSLREFSGRSRRACSRGHERRCGARSAIGRCPL